MMCNITLKTFFKLFAILFIITMLLKACRSHINILYEGKVVDISESTFDVLDSTLSNEFLFQLEGKATNERGVHYGEIEDFTRKYISSKNGNLRLSIYAYEFYSIQLAQSKRSHFTKGHFGYKQDRAQMDSLFNSEKHLPESSLRACYDIDYGTACQYMNWFGNILVHIYLIEEHQKSNATIYPEMIELFAFLDSTILSITQE